MKTRITLVLASTLLGIIDFCGVSFPRCTSHQDEIANRVHLRPRTSRFYHRASTNGRHAKLNPQWQNAVVLFEDTLDMQANAS